MRKGYDGKTFIGRWVVADQNKPRKGMNVIATVQREDGTLFVRDCIWNGYRWLYMPKHYKVIAWFVIDPYKEEV